MSPRDPAQDLPNRTRAAGFVALGLAVLGAVLVEGAVVAAVALLGGPLAFLCVAAGCAAITTTIAWAFDADETRHGEMPLVMRVRRWIASKRDEATMRAERVARVAWWLGFVILSVTVGPFLTTIVTKVRGTDAATGYVLGVASSVIFSATWVAIYAGGIAAVRVLV